MLFTSDTHLRVLCYFPLPLFTFFLWTATKTVSLGDCFLPPASGTMHTNELICHFCSFNYTTLYSRAPDEVRNSLCVIPVQYALIWRHERITSFKSACFRIYWLICLQILKIKLKVSRLWLVTFRNSHSSPFVEYRFTISQLLFFFEQ